MDTRTSRRPPAGRVHRAGRCAAQRQLARVRVGGERRSRHRRVARLLRQPHRDRRPGRGPAQGEDPPRAGRGVGVRRCCRRHPRRRLRAGPVDRPHAGVQLRRLRLHQEAGRPRHGRVTHRRDGAALPDRCRWTRLGVRDRPHGDRSPRRVPRRETPRAGRRDRGAAPALRGGDPAHPPRDDRPAAVPHAVGPAPPRLAVLRREDAAVTAGRLRPDLGRTGPAGLRRRAIGATVPQRGRGRRPELV